MRIALNLAQLGSALSRGSTQHERASRSTMPRLAFRAHSRTALALTHALHSHWLVRFLSEVTRVRLVLARRVSLSRV